VSSGIIFGYPTSSSPATFVVRATNAYGFDDQSLTITIGSSTAPAIVETPLAGETATTLYIASGVAYNRQLTATGTAPITWAVTSGSLPLGLTLSANGLISGTTTAIGDYVDVTITATNTSGTDTIKRTFSVGSVPVINETPLIGTTETSNTLYVTSGTAYNRQISVTSTQPGTWTTTWAVTSGTLPVGLSLSNTGLISGISTDLGDHLVTITATNQGGSDTFVRTISVGAAPAITSSSVDLPQAIVNSPYNATLIASGTAPITWDAAFVSATAASAWESSIRGAGSTYDPAPITTGIIKHVAKTGSDTLGDGTSGNPYLTINKAASVIGAGGGVIYVGTGTYNESITLPAGVIGNLVQLLRVPGANVIMNGGGTLASAITLAGGYVTVHGISFTGYTASVITSAVTGTGYTFQYLTATDSAGLLRLAANSSAIDIDNVIYSTGNAVTPVTAIDLRAGGCSGITIERTNLSGTGTDSTSPVSGIVVTTAGTTSLTRCLIKNFSGNAASLNTTAGALTVSGCKLAQTTAAGYSLLQINVGAGQTATIESNLIYRTQQNTFGYDVVSVKTGTGNVIFRRNTVYNDSASYCYTFNDQVGANLKLQGNILFNNTLNGSPIVTSVGKPAVSQSNNWRYNDFYAPGAIVNAISFDDTANAGAGAVIYTLDNIVSGAFDTALSAQNMLGNKSIIPVFYDLNGLNFRLDAADTGCRNSYIDNVLSSQADQDGNPSQNGAYMDIGCFES
jgi:hypothetical protein